MRHLSHAARSRTALLVVIGVLLVPTIALGARAISGWQAGSVVVKKLGPLPTYSWVIADSATDGAFYFTGDAPIALPPVNLGGAIMDQVAFQVTMTVPPSVVDSIRDIVAQRDLDDLSEGCYLELNWWSTQYVVGIAGFNVVGEIVEEALSAMGGTHTYTATATTLGAGIAQMLTDGAVRLDIWCEGIAVEPSNLGSSPITVTVNSVRVLAY